MPLSGAGVYTAPASTWKPAVGATTISSVDWNSLLADLSTALSTALYKDGQQTVTANLPMAGFILTGLGTGLAARTSSVRTGDAQDGTATFVAAGGTVDAITATFVPAITAVVDGMLLGVRASGANATTTPTFSPNGLTARTIVKQGGQALVAGDIRAANHDLLLRYRAGATVWELLNPTSSVFTSPLTTKGDLFTYAAADARLAVGSAGQRLMPATGATPGLAWLADGFAIGMVNGSLAWSVSGNALTVALKDSAGADPTTSTPVWFAFRNATAATGTYTWIAVTAALSVVVSSGSTLGTVNSEAFKVWCGAINNAGTVELAVVQAVTTTGGSKMIGKFRESQLVTTIAEGGAGAADSSATFYSTTARSAVAMRILGYGEWGSGLATVGTWASGPTQAQLYAPGVPLPGDIVQTTSVQDGAVATGSTAIPLDDTIPQSGEGDQYMSQAITPMHAAHILVIEARVLCAINSAAGNAAIVALFQDAVASALVASAFGNVNSTAINDPWINWVMRANTAASTTLKIRAGPNTAVTFTFNGSATARLFGGVINSFLNITELAT